MVVRRARRRRRRWCVLPPRRRRPGFVEKKLPPRRPRLPPSRLLPSVEHPTVLLRSTTEGQKECRDRVECCFSCRCSNSVLYADRPHTRMYLSYLCTCSMLGMAGIETFVNCTADVVLLPLSCGVCSSTANPTPKAFMAGILSPTATMLSVQPTAACCSSKIDLNFEHQEQVLLNFTAQQERNDWKRSCDGTSVTTSLDAVTARP